MGGEKKQKKAQEQKLAEEGFSLEDLKNVDWENLDASEVAAFLREHKDEVKAALMENQAEVAAFLHENKDKIEAFVEENAEELQEFFDELKAEMGFDFSLEDVKTEVEDYVIDGLEMIKKAKKGKAAKEAKEE